MATLTLNNDNKTTLQGVTSSSDHTTQFRGIKYASIPRRFAPSKLVELNHTGEIDCTEFGPVCPHVWIDPRILLRVPESLEHGPFEASDEFGCCNLTVTVPEGAWENGKGKQKGLPVFVWVYGGSQTMAYGTPASRFADMRPFVAASVAQGQPIIAVALNYRLSIFAFGDGEGEGEFNLALKDQRVGIEWVRRYIDAFGGDPDQITLAGESAGAVYVHGHLFTGAPVKRAVLMSGHLPLSPPLPRGFAGPLLEKLVKKAEEGGYAGGSLREVKVDELVGYVREVGWPSMWLQQEGELAKWKIGEEGVEELLIGDCEYESAIFRTAFDKITSADNVLASFEKSPSHGKELAEMYHVFAGREQAAKLGGLDFINDLRFAKPANDIATKWREAGKPAYQYVVDQANPWQASARAHHAVDLTMLFGGYDLSFNPVAEEVAKDMRSKWISFVNGKAPWSTEKRFAFGPVGHLKEIDDKEYSHRRRVKQFEVIQKCDPKELGAIWGSIAGGRISIDN